MQIDASQLAANLRRGLQALYLLHGDEALLVQEAADQVRATARAQGFDERVVHTAVGASFDWSEVLAAAASLGLFAQRQIVELRIPSGKPGKSGATALQQLAQMSVGSDSSLLLLLLPRLDKDALDSAWFAALESRGVAVRIQPIERGALTQWIAQRLQQQGLQVEPGEAGQQSLQFFADRVEGNLLAAHQEIQKLALLYPPGVLTQQQLQNAVFNVARYDVAALSEAVLSGQVARAQRILDGLQAEGVAEVLVHWSLAEDIRALLRGRRALSAGRPMPMALREARVWRNKERLFERALPLLSEAKLHPLLQAAHVVDGIVKGLSVPDWPSNGWQALNHLALLLCQACAARPPRGKIR